MARPVPIGEIEPQVPVEEGLRRIIPQRSGISTGPALENLGAGMERVAQGQAANFTLQAMSQAQKEWTQHLLDRQQTAGPGAPGFTAAMEKDYSDYVSKTLKGAPTPLAGKMLSLKLNEFGNQLLQHSMQFEAKQRQDNNINIATKSVEDAGNELMLNPNLFGQRLAERRDLINQMNLDPDVKQKLIDHATDSMANFATRGAIEQDPYKAMMDIQNPQNLYTKVLTPELRSQLLDHADRMLHQRVADAERLEMLTKKQQSDTADNIVKQGILMAQKGQLSGDWVTKQAPLLKPQELKFLFDEMSGREIKSDVHTYSDLLTRAAHGEDVTDDAKSALYSGRLSTEDFTKVEDMGAKDQPNWIKRGTQYITSMSGYSELNPNIESAQLKARMIDEWQDWTKDHPKATDKEAQIAYQDIVMNSMLVKLAGLPKIKYLVGTSIQPDVNASMKATTDAYKRGELSKDDFDRESFVLMQYERAMSAQFGGKAHTTQAPK